MLNFEKLESKKNQTA